MLNSLKNQQGVSLLVSMVILILVSLIGVTALKNASVEEQISSNLYQKNLTFQASESAVEQSLLNDTIISQAMSSNSSVNQEIQTAIPHTSATVDYRYLNNAPIVGYSQGVFAGASLMVTSTATIGDTRTRTVHGLVRLVPDMNNQ